MTMVRKPFAVAVIAMMMAIAACADLNGTAPLPSDTVDEETIRDAAGAAGMAIAAEVHFQRTYGEYVLESGFITDELQSNERGPSFIGSDPVDYVSLDARSGLSSGFSDQLYLNLHKVRTLTAQAGGALAKYDPDHGARRRGLMYALAGYAEIYLADLFCSGVPLSTYDFEGDFTYKPGSSTDDVYRHALALFDTALALGMDSAPVTNLAKLGASRALLALGQYASAADTIRTVSTDFRFTAPVMECGLGQLLCSIKEKPPSIYLAYRATVSEREGGTGIPFVSQRDPRTAARSIGTTQYNFPVYFPSIYTQSTVNQLTVASGVEARMASAEVALRSGDPASWYATLRDLRTTGQFTIDTVFADDAHTVIVSVDTAWEAGTGGVAGIRPLPPDPGASQSDPTAALNARLDLLFVERGNWLFLSGHRQADLRRRVRKDHRAATQAYPSGAYPGIGVYGSYIDVDIPATESRNPYFTGCLSRD